MPRLTGPDFIAIQTEDLQAARAFYGDRLGLPVLQETPQTIVFDSKPAPFAVRKPLVDLEAVQGKLGWGIALWFGCDDADALHEELKAAGTKIAFPPKDGPFGRYFAFRDPFGYTITAHTI
ncbi:VOC family protein [Acetobacter sp.]|jgi:predicted enzyme related to lactoylglutathione lyase|uniref:VOC family protein n=1 Tax=Acetobacter sp. TaxID=440 RepID=UPI0025C5AE76|nr:VOC family protein [Acetobacter sp.]MCH4091200.1 VOC family protein [Acetobacter sp.]MCI1301369.1 VOC family protein [Acetobacter sp.]